MKIGFFDSGLGGLTILSAVRAVAPQYDYVYFGDTENLPFGDKTEEEIYELTKRAVYKLFDRGALLVIIACNTASAETLRSLQDTILTGTYAHHRILGVIVPTVESIIESGAKRVFLIGTKRTIHSGKYERELKKRGNEQEIELSAQATPELVPLIELHEMKNAESCIYEILAPMKGKIDAVVLGCTHYTLLKEYIRKTFKEAFCVISQDEVIPAKVQTYLRSHPEIETKLSRNGTIEIELSKNSDTYTTLTKQLLQSM